MPAPTLTGREKVLAALESTMQGLMYVVSRAHERIALAQTAFDVPLAKLEQRRNMIEKQLKELERNKGYLEGTIVRFGEVIAGKVFSNRPGRGARQPRSRQRIFLQLG